jgi:asparagine synthase (glutamine-hydrolysing)
MCGISGFFSNNSTFNKEVLVKMTDAIAHRGPNASGYYQNEFVGLGHRRLSIIDLSETANQPMHSANNRYVMVYNGEVYNYLEIADELKQKFNSTFNTTSDSEIILEAYVHYGPRFLEKINGMFAIAIYDKIKNELFVCRDRIGIKPLYYFWDGTNFAFASELKALTKCPSIPLSIDKNAVHQFMHLGFIPAPLSIYKSIQKLESGTWLNISENNLHAQKYWTINKQVSKNTISNKKKAKKTLTDLIFSSVKYQLQSDVPFGVFLSGGTDSSLITAVASNLSKEKLNTFSIGFEENKFNESVHAKSIANHLGTNHHEFIVSYKDAMNLIEPIFEIYDEPYSDSSAIPTLLVSKLAKQHVTVALSGDGGDELFLGYGAHQWARRLNNPFIKAFRHPIASALSLSNSKFERHATYFKYPSKNLQYSHILSQEQNCFTLTELENILSDEFKKTKNSNSTTLFEKFGNDIENLNRNLKPIEKQAIFDLHFYLQDDLLTKVDRASMHYSLEARVPFLDHRIIEYALNLSPDLKYYNGTSKYLLKEILYQYVPKNLLDRPKQGFSIPLEKWLKNELKYLIEENLSKEIIEKYNYVNYTYVNQLVKNFFNGKNYLYNRIWILIVLHKWLIKNNL